MARSPKDEKLGSNLPASLDEETFNSALRQHDKFEEERAALNKRVGRFRKVLKSMGVKLKLFDAALALRGLEQAEITGDIKEQFKYMRWMNLKPGSQGELFPSGKEAPEPHAAYKHGFAMGVKGEGKRQPPPEFIQEPGAQEWFKGWDDGQKKLGRDMFAKMDFDAMDDDDPILAGGPDGEGDDDLIPEYVETDGKVTKLSDVKAVRDAAKPPGAPKSDAPTGTKDPDVKKAVAAMAKAVAPKEDASAVIKRVAEKKRAEKKAAKPAAKKPAPKKK